MKTIFNRKRISFVSGLLACLMCVALLAGCGSSAPAAPVKDTLVVGAIDPQYALDMHDCTQSTVMKMTDNMLESLFRSMPDGSLQCVLVTGMPTISEDNLVYTFELQDGTTFHNGAPLTANDVKFSYTRVCEKNSMASLMEYVVGYDAVMAGEADTLEGIEVIDDTHFTITLSSPYSPFLSVLSTPYTCIYPAEACAAAGDDWGRGTLYGTGPYMLDSYESGVGAEISAYEGFHGEQPYFKHITYKFIDDVNTQILEFKQGNIDYCDVTSTLYLTYSNDPAVKDLFHTYQAVGGFFATMNCKSIPDANVRHAISISMDRAAICNAIMAGTANPATSFIPAGILGHDDTLEAYEYNPELAKQLLADAGYPNGYDLRVTVSNKYPDTVTIVTAWQEQAKAAGINITIETVDNSAWSDMRKSGGVDCGLGNWYVDYNDPDSMLYPVADARADDRSFFWHNAEYKALCEEGVVENDSAKRDEIYKRAEYILTREEWAVAPVYNEMKFYLLNPEITGFQMDSTFRYYFFDATMG